VPKSNDHMRVRVWANEQSTKTYPQDSVEDV
jgi:hypothetical protein